MEKPFCKYDLKEQFKKFNYKTKIYEKEFI